MVILLRGPGLLLVLASIIGLASAVNYLPALWSFAFQAPVYVTSRWGTTPTTILVAGQGAWVHIYDIISQCYAVDGSFTSELECANSVIVALFSFGLSVLNYQSARTWTKRDTTNADMILNLIPDTIKVTDIKILGEPIIANSSSPSLRRDLHASDDPINVDYNGTLPFTFIMHQEVPGSSRRRGEPSYIPIFVATDGQRAEIGHISHAAPNATDISTNSTGPARRNDISSYYNYKYTGGVVIDSNTDATMYWDQVSVWLFSFNYRMMDEITALTRKYAIIGHSYTQVVNGYLNGQFNLVGMTTPVPAGWITGLNWCYGVHQTNCS